MVKMFRYITFYFVAFLGTSCNSESEQIDNDIELQNVAFIKTLGGSLNDSGQAITKKTDGGYTILGYTQSQDLDILDKQDDSFDFWVLNYDSNDNLSWAKTYGGSEDDKGNDIIQTQDNGFAILGSSQSNNGDATENQGSLDYWILKLNSQGAIIWQKSFGFSGADFGLSLIQTQDSGFLITGELDVTASNGEGNSDGQRAQLHAGGDYWAIKLNGAGQLEWSRYFGGTFTDTALSVIETDDQHFILAGLSDSFDIDITGNKGSYDFWVVKIDANGALVWEKSFGGTEVDEAKAVITSNDGGFIVAGNTRSNNSDISNNKGAADVWIIKIDSEGNLIWEKTFGGSSFDTANSISKTEDNGYIIAGNSRSSDFDLTQNQGQNDAWVIKITNEGSLVWQQSIGGSNIDFATDAIELNNQNIIIVGESNSNDGNINENKGFSDLLIFKITPL